MKLLSVLLLLLLAAGCTPARPPHPADAPPAPGWSLEAGQGGEVDRGRPFVSLDGPVTVLLNLPGVRDYTVLELRLAGAVLHIVTDLPDGPVEWGQSPCLLAWPYGDNLKILRLDAPLPPGTSCRLLTDGGRELALGVSLAAAVQAARDYAGADFGWPTHAALAFLEGREGLHYRVDCTDDQVISRDGTAAVKGHFLVDARTGAVTESELGVFPLASTRHLVRNGDFLTWLDADTALVLACREDTRLEGLDTAGRAVFSHPVEAEAGFFLGVTPAAAAFAHPGGHILVSLVTGEVTWGAGNPAGLLPPAAAEPLAIVGREGQAMAVAAAGRTFTLDLAALGYFSEPRRGAWCATSEKLYFSSEIEGPRYGIWVTEYRLWELDGRTGDIREVTAMPGEGFYLSPGGRWVAYRHGGHTSLVDLR